MTTERGNESSVPKFRINSQNEAQESIAKSLNKKSLEGDGDASDTFNAVYSNRVQTKLHHHKNINVLYQTSFEGKGHDIKKQPTNLQYGV